MPETALPLSRSSWTAICLFSYQKVPPASGRGIFSDARNSTAAGFAAQLGIYLGHLRGRLLAPSPDREPSSARGSGGQEPNCSLYLIAPSRLDRSDRRGDRLHLTRRRGLRFHRPFRDTMSIAGFNASLKLGGALWFAVSTLLLLPTLAARSTVVVRIGQNFTGSTFGFQANESAYVPADCNGAVGPNHFVELINGLFSVYNKASGGRVQIMTGLDFWSQAGVNLPNGWDVSDPRIIYDLSVQRWVAAQIDFDSSGLISSNHFLLAISASADPTGPWKGLFIPVDPSGTGSADFTTLGLDAQGVYLAADMFDANGIGLDSSTLVSIPKTNLLASTPSATNRTWFGSLSYSSRGASLQPAICFDQSSSGNVLAVGNLGLDYAPHSTLKASTVLKAEGPSAATLAAPTTITVSPYSVPINPPQPDGTSDLDDGDTRLTAQVYTVGGVLYAVHSTEVASRAAIRWYRLSATNYTVIESGTITDTNLDLFYPSIAANASGTVVIGCNACSSDSFVSAYALVGATVNGVTSFNDLLLLKAGVASYHNTASGSDNRWGDYSATSVDPSDPTHFWTVQMYPSGPSTWSTQVIELLTGAPRLTVAAAGANVMISWPSYAAGLELQSSESLAPSATWTNVTQVTFTNGNQVTVVVPASAALQFFRLSQAP